MKAAFSKKLTWCTVMWKTEQNCSVSNHLSSLVGRIIEQWTLTCCHHPCIRICPEHSYAICLSFEGTDTSFCGKEVDLFYLFNQKLQLVALKSNVMTCCFVSFSWWEYHSYRKLKVSLLGCSSKPFLSRHSFYKEYYLLSCSDVFKKIIHFHGKHLFDCTWLKLFCKKWG